MQVMDRDRHRDPGCAVEHGDNVLSPPRLATVEFRCP
jgi:hypothetical protein